VDIYSIDITGGYSGTVQITKGKLHLERGDGIGGGYSFSDEIKFYHFCLLTPERKNIEFYLLRFLNGAWCDEKNMYPPLQWGMDKTLILRAKAEVFRLGL
jgi:hypothetical protein